MPHTNIQEKVPPPQLDRFFRSFGEIASLYKWELVIQGSRETIRTKVDGSLLCPVMTLAYHKSGKNIKDREIPSSSHMSGPANLSHSGTACVVHNADEIQSSRYYRPELRERLLTLTGLVKKEEPAEPTKEPASVLTQATT